jgi:hypothetical protein
METPRCRDRGFFISNHAPTLSSSKVAHQKNSDAITQRAQNNDSSGTFFLRAG